VRPVDGSARANAAHARDAAGCKLGVDGLAVDAEERGEVRDREDFGEAGR